jgi:hypothetical protein
VPGMGKGDDASTGQHVHQDVEDDVPRSVAFFEVSTLGHTPPCVVLFIVLCGV